MYMYMCVYTNVAIYNIYTGDWEIFVVKIFLINVLKYENSTHEFFLTTNNYE